MSFYCLLLSEVHSFRVQFDVLVGSPPRSDWPGRCCRFEQLAAAAAAAAVAAAAGCCWLLRRQQQQRQQQHQQQQQVHERELFFVRWIDRADRGPSFCMPTFGFPPSTFLFCKTFLRNLSYATFSRCTAASTYMQRVC